MTRLRTTVQSFDLFDTLIARACVTPANLFSELGSALGMPSFADQRMAAEQRVVATGQAFDLDTIYRELVASGFCDVKSASVLMKAEIEAEFDNAIPITENLSAVRDHDLVVSDMYLPAATLRGLLQHVGMRRFVHLFVSNAGKHHGTIWPQLMQRWLVLHHTGDNAHADVAQAQRFGIPTRHYLGASASPTEHYLQSAGLAHTSRAARQLRLANPFQPSSLESDFWNHFVQFNFPLLCLATQVIRTQRDALGLERILFLARDCHFLSEVFLTLRPCEAFELVHVSRSALAADPHGFACYLQSCGLDDALVCDLVSTGYSWLQFCESTTQAVALFTLVYVDNYQYQTFDANRLQQDGLLRFFYAVKSSEINAWSLAIELLNTAPHGSTLSIDTIGDRFTAQFEDHHELPPTLLKTLLLAQAAAVQCLRQNRVAIATELEGIKNPQPLISALVSAMSGTYWLNRFATAAICHPSHPTI